MLEHKHYNVRSHFRPKKIKKKKKKTPLIIPLKFQLCPNTNKTVFCISIQHQVKWSKYTKINLAYQHQNQNQESVRMPYISSTSSLMSQIKSVLRCFSLATSNDAFSISSSKLRATKFGGIILLVQHVQKIKEYNVNMSKLVMDFGIHP